MPSFRRVEGDQAGPNALGILIPPGPRTLVIVRPRALDWDLLLLRSGLLFWEIDAIATEIMMQRVQRALEECAGGGPGRIELVPLADGRGYFVRAATGSLTWVVCGRTPGRPYRPMLFPTEADARGAAACLDAVLCPSAGA